MSGRKSHGLSSYTEKRIRAANEKTVSRRIIVVVFLTIIATVTSAWVIWGSGSREERYEVKGRVVSVDRERKRVTIDHEEIKGYMDAMTMPFPVRDERELDGLEPEDTIKGTLIIDGDRYWIEKISVVQKGK